MPWSPMQVIERTHAITVARGGERPSSGIPEQQSELTVEASQSLNTQSA